MEGTVALVYKDVDTELKIADGRLVKGGGDADWLDISKSYGKATLVVSRSGTPHPRFVRSKVTTVAVLPFRGGENVCQQKVGKSICPVDHW
jgi:hypothetical protein